LPLIIPDRHEKKSPLFSPAAQKEG